MFNKFIIIINIIDIDWAICIDNSKQESFKIYSRYWSEKESEREIDGLAKGQEKQEEKFAIYWSSSVHPVLEQ